MQCLSNSFKSCRHMKSEDWMKKKEEIYCIFTSKVSVVLLHIFLYFSSYRKKFSYISAPTGNYYMTLLSFPITKVFVYLDGLTAERFQILQAQLYQSFHNIDCELGWGVWLEGKENWLQRRNSAINR